MTIPERYRQFQSWYRSNFEDVVAWLVSALIAGVIFVSAIGLSSLDWTPAVAACFWGIGILVCFALFVGVAMLFDSGSSGTGAGGGSAVGFFIVLCLLASGSRGTDRPKETEGHRHTAPGTSYSELEGKPSDMPQDQYEYVVRRYEAEGFTNEEARDAAGATWEFHKKEEYRKQHVYPYRD